LQRRKEESGQEIKRVGPKNERQRHRRHRNIGGEKERSLLRGNPKEKNIRKKEGQKKGTIYSRLARDKW